MLFYWHYSFVKEYEGYLQSIDDSKAIDRNVDIFIRFNLRRLSQQHESLRKNAGGRVEREVMNHSQVNTLLTSLRSDASAQIKGFLYQFVVAIEQCFHLSPGQSLYIEKYGDVAIKNDGTYDETAGDVSIEVKLYSDELDVNHHNLLNTLYNWMEEDFGYENYQALIIYTTQPFAAKSPLKGWNTMKGEERYDIVNKVYTKYLTANKEKIEDKNEGKHKSIKSNAKQMERVLGSVKNEEGDTDENASKERLMSLLSRVRIVDSCENFEQAYKDLFKYAKVTTDNLREHFIQCMLGFIISPNNINNGWRIDHDTFTTYYQTLVKEMLPQSISFPEAPEVDFNEKDYADALFVSKLKRIDYDRISDAMIDYAKTTGLLSGEFKRPSAEKNLEEYQSNMEKLYWNRYDNAKDELLLTDNMTDEKIIIKSRIFLRHFQEACRAIGFAPFGCTRIYFSNGMCHYLANDNEKNIKWILKDE